MNFLAHFWLAREEKEWMVGNVIADLVKGAKPQAYSAGIGQGIRQHRAIDSYTDGHPVVRRATARLHEPFGKYAPVVNDVYFDYCLVKTWAVHTDWELPLFARYVYDTLLEYSDQLPPPFARNLPYMVENQWLERYGTQEGLGISFGKLSQRATFPNRLQKAHRMISDFEELHIQDFNEFFPELEHYIMGWKQGDAG
jgi:acyl carrier protein phosphodiesterase